MDTQQPFQHPDYRVGQEVLIIGNDFYGDVYHSFPLNSTGFIRRKRPTQPEDVQFGSSYEINVGNYVFPQTIFAIHLRPLDNLSKKEIPKKQNLPII